MPWSLGHSCQPQYQEVLLSNPFPFHLLPPPSRSRFLIAPHIRAAISLWPHIFQAQMASQYNFLALRKFFLLTTLIPAKVFFLPIYTCKNDRGHFPTICFNQALGLGLSTLSHYPEGAHFIDEEAEEGSGEGTWCCLSLGSKLLTIAHCLPSLNHSQATV